MPVATVQWHKVFSGPYPVDIAPLDGGAVIGSRSFLGVVKGASFSQDPRWLARVPEWINWDAGVSLQLPSAAAPTVHGLPLDLRLIASAGNVHGPGIDAWWSRHGWTTRAHPPDPRLTNLPRPAGGWEEHVALSFPSGALMVVRCDSKVESFLVQPGQRRPVVSDLPLSADAYRRAATHDLVGNAPDDAYLCNAGSNIEHYDGTTWTAVTPDDFRPCGCALTSDGTIWEITEDGPRVLMSGAWISEPLPDGVNPTAIFAAGSRVWVAATGPSGTAAYSNQPVVDPVSIAENNLPGPLSIPGISGLNVVSVDVISVSATPAGPGTRACTSLVAWLGPKLTEKIRSALGPSPPPLVTVAGMRPGHAVLVAPGRASMRVQPSGRWRTGVAALPRSYHEGEALVRAVNLAIGYPGAGRLPTQPAATAGVSVPLPRGARLICAKPRVVRRLKRASTVSGKAGHASGH